MVSGISVGLFVSGACHLSSLYSNRYWNKELGMVIQTIALDILCKERKFQKGREFIDAYGWTLVIYTAKNRFYGQKGEGDNIAKATYSLQEMLTVATLVASVVSLFYLSADNKLEILLTKGAIGTHLLYFSVKFWKEAAAGFDPTAEISVLPNYLTNLSLERAITPPSLVGRKADLEDLLATLFKPSQSHHPLLVGPPGCGKTELAKTLAYRIRGEDLSTLLLNGRPLRDYTVLELSMSGLLSGTKYRGEFEDKIKALEKYLKSRPVILFVDEVHMIMGAGETTEGTMSFSNMLKPLLTQGHVFMIGATTDQEYEHVKGDPALNRRFTVTKVESMTGEEIKQVIKNFFQRQQSKRKIYGWFQPTGELTETGQKHLQDFHQIASSLKGRDDVSPAFEIDLAATVIGYWETQPTLALDKVLNKIHDKKNQAASSAHMTMYT